MVNPEIRIIEGRITEVLLYIAKQRPGDTKTSKDSEWD